MKLELSSDGVEELIPKLHLHTLSVIALVFAISWKLRLIKSTC
jgi:hypothetical protein